MFHDCRSERKLWASATVNRADPMLSRTSSENPSDPSLRAASEKNSSSSYSLEIITALRWQWEWQKQWDSTCEVASLLTEGRRRNNTRRFRRALMLGWRWPAEHLNILIDHYLVGRHLSGPTEHHSGCWLQNHQLSLVNLRENISEAQEGKIKLSHSSCYCTNDFLPELHSECEVLAW